jgi:hypothetical protein
MMRTIRKTARRRRLQRAGLLLVVLAALALPLRALADAQVPYQGSDSGGFAVPGTCGAGLQVVIAGSGNATHLGRYAYNAIECFNPATGAFAGSPTLTVANGDTLVGTYSGQVFPTADPNVITYEEVLVVTGGTGHFAGASGEFEVSGLANLATGEYSQTMAGTLSSPGSAKQ